LIGLFLVFVSGHTHTHARTHARPHANRPRAQAPDSHAHARRARIACAARHHQAARALSKRVKRCAHTQAQRCACRHNQCGSHHRASSPGGVACRTHTHTHTHTRTHSAHMRQTTPTHPKQPLALPHPAHAAPRAVQRVHVRPAASAAAPTRVFFPAPSLFLRGAQRVAEGGGSDIGKCGDLDA
jgi:hypothetical protein